MNSEPRSESFICCSTSRALARAQRGRSEQSEWRSLHTSENSLISQLSNLSRFLFFPSTISFNQRCYATILISHWSVKRRYQGQNFWFISSIKFGTATRKCANYIATLIKRNFSLVPQVSMGNGLWGKQKLDILIKIFLKFVKTDRKQKGFWGKYRGAKGII